MITVAGDFMALSDDRRHGLGITFGDAAAGEKRRFDFVWSEDAQNPPNPRVGTVFALGVFLVIDPAVLIRLHVFAALKIEAQENRDPGIARPLYLAAGV